MVEQRSDRLIEMLERVLETEKLPMEGDVDFKVQDYWDSLKYMSLVLEIETEFQISFQRRVTRNHHFIRCRKKY